MNDASNSSFSALNALPSRVALAALLVSNIALALLALHDDRGFLFLLYAYWADIVIVGAFNVPKILIAVALSHPTDSTADIIDAATQVGGALLMLLFYVGFCATIGMALFTAVGILPTLLDLVHPPSNTRLMLPIGEGIRVADVKLIFGCLFASHAVSFVANFVYRREYRNASVIALVLQPFLRTGLVVLTLAIAAVIAILQPAAATTTAFAVALVTFKIGADVFGHLRERRRFASAAADVRGRFALRANRL
jgi:hypothetical protein